MCEIDNFNERFMVLKKKHESECVSDITNNMRRGILTKENAIDYLTILRDNGLIDSEPTIEEVSNYFEIMSTLLFENKTVEMESAYNYGVIVGATQVIEVVRSRLLEEEGFKKMPERDKMILQYIYDNGHVFGKEIIGAVKGASYKKLKQLEEHGYISIRKLGQWNDYTLTLKGDRYIEFVAEKGHKG